MSEQKLSRRQARENAFLAAFAATYQPQEPQTAVETLTEEGGLQLDAFAHRLLADLQLHGEEIDAVITAHLKGWTLARVSRASTVALRIALAELLYGEEQKTGVAINEAVELVKKYGAENDYQFVNGLLGAVARERAENGTAATPC